MTRRTLSPQEEADVVARLERALHARPDEAVDVADLLRRTRGGIRRSAVRRRTTVLVAAAAAVAVPLAVALTVGTAGLRAGGAGPAGQGAGPVTSAAADPSASATTSPSDVPTTQPPTAAASEPASGSPYPTLVTKTGPTDGSDTVPQPDPTASVRPFAEVVASDDPNLIAYPIPDAVTFHADDFPQPMKLYPDNGDYRFTPTVMGQGCGSNPDRERTPVSAHQRAWSEEYSNRLSQTSVDLVVTAWAPGTAPARFAEIGANTGVCRWSGSRPTKVSTAGMPGDEQWAASFVQAGYSGGRAAVRVGDVIVSVEVWKDHDTAGAVELARRLAGLAADRAVSSGLVATAANPS